ncbi:hypothetical protein DH2020_047946 [Rehmannia glutinosa]|uniref:Pentatricopeptide repeat-containing protein n=1 Tax=Rehmannia glutinosa TaxID=99300 RepID=A0ABR0U899_REHGL
MLIKWCEKKHAGLEEAVGIPHLLRSIRSFSSIDDGLGRSDYPPEPIPNRPLRRQSYPYGSPRIPKPNRGREIENQNSFRGETDADFLERFKLGFDSKVENPKIDSADKSIQSEKAENMEPLSPPEDADEIFKKMKETGLIPNAVAMLDGLCKDGLVQEAMKLFGLMREKGTIPEVVVYTAVVEGFCKAHKFDDAVRIFKKMQSNGVIPNVFSYQVLVRGLFSGKRLEDAYGFTIEMLEAGHSPNIATFTGLVDGYCREKGLEEAQNVIGAMRQKGFFFEEKAVRDYLDKKGPFLPSVWEAILGKKASKRSLF